MISGKNKELYYTSSIDKQLNIEVVGTRIVIDNSMREQDTFTLTEALNDGSELKFGSCLPNQISFIAHDMPAGLVGKTLRPVETLEGNEDDPFTYGKYKISLQFRPQIAPNVRSRLTMLCTTSSMQM